MQVTIGGDRLGSGNKNKTALRDYERSTHNLTQKFTSSLQVGTLYPFLVIPAMRGDKFDIDLNADARTIPTKGPLFGSFKMQMDLFECPIRLYQAILHNNPLAIGLKMNQVKFPVLDIHDDNKGNAFSNSCLLKYMGLSGLGHAATDQNINRKINAVPALAYYEIFKTYYSNKQEENAYIIGTQLTEGYTGDFTYSFTIDGTETETDNNEMAAIGADFPINVKVNTHSMPQNGWENKVYIKWYDADENMIGAISFKNAQETQPEKTIKKIGINEYAILQYPNFPSTKTPTYIAFGNMPGEETYIEETRGLEPFALANIDEMRLKLLSHHELGVPFNITNSDDDNAGTWDAASGANNDGMPYIKLVDTIADDEYKTLNTNPLNGLVIKTYQSDIFNNWVNTEWIDGENGIAEVTAISTASGSIKIDTINLSEKLYNMLNRIAVSDGTYESWQDVVYTDTPRRHIESPIYLGGMSSEVMFEEIVQTSASTEESPLGNLGGKGKLYKNKGGHVTVKCSEACFIIGIVSLTPRINYCQGNEFYLTDLLSMDDFHKPALDGIGFQNLIAERMAWWDTAIAGANVANRHSVGKVPAWVEYMTAVDKCYGDFAETEGRGFMTLLRDYTRTADNQIQDATTYIDPRKYNYAFAYQDIDAQNFWVQIKSDIKARRLMSAKQIPNI